MGELVATGADRLAAVPLVLVAAGHAKGDIPAALTREQQRHPGLHVAYGRPLGPHPTILTVLRQRLSTAGADPHTTVLLVGRGSTDPDANAEVAKIASPRPRYRTTTPTTPPRRPLDTKPGSRDSSSWPLRSQPAPRAPARSASRA